MTSFNKSDASWILNIGTYLLKKLDLLGFLRTNPQYVVYDVAR